MPPDERLRRPVPARDRPDRAFHPKAAAANNTPRPPIDGAAASPPGIGNEAVMSAVETAYRVVDDNVREGRLAAARLRAAAQTPGEAPPDMKAVAGRLMHMTREIGATWADLFSAVIREPEVRAMIDRLAFHERPQTAGPAAGSSPGSPTVIQRLSSRKPIEVTLSELAATATDSPPRIGGLHALDGTNSIGQVEFVARVGGGLELRLSVPDNQPAGDYAGVVMDPGGRRAIGTLTVRVLD